MEYAHKSWDPQWRIASNDNGDEEAEFDTELWLGGDPQSDLLAFAYPAKTWVWGIRDTGAFETLFSFEVKDVVTAIKKAEIALRIAQTFEEKNSRHITEKELLEKLREKEHALRMKNAKRAAKALNAGKI